MIEEKLPTRIEAAWFQFRAACFRLKRFATDWSHRAPGRLTSSPIPESAICVADSRTVLFNSASPAEFALQAGKVQNLRLAACALHGLVIRQGDIFSFWKNIGRATRRRGFVPGRELREGCVIPNVGGGLCQLSNALYDVALRAGCEIVERHAHTQRLPGSTTKPGRDATVFWNYVDLRFAPRFDCQLRVELSRGELTVGLCSLNGAHPIPIPVQLPATSCETRVEVVESCETCGVTKCFRNPAATSLPRHGVTAWLLDKFEPEFDAWINENRDERDWIFLPFQGLTASQPSSVGQRLGSRRSLFGLGNYRWSTGGFEQVNQARLTTLRRSLRSRRLATQGAKRQRALLEFDREMAIAFARKIPHLADHLVISQNLLPHLWRRGDLGGRTFDVLMTRHPMAELERMLDVAAKLHPQSRTLSDFRATPDLRDAESEALAAARFLITPHSQIAALDPNRSIKLDWQLPETNPQTKRTGAIVFPASTLARKGCYEMRELARELQIPLQLAGPVIEAADFWDQVEVAPAAPDWTETAALVILPAWVEHWPRRLLRAAAAGVPIIASEECGLRGVGNVTEVPAGDFETLRRRVSETLRGIRA